MKRATVWLVLALCSAPALVSAQSMAERLKQKAKERAEQLEKKAADKADSAADKVLDKVECLVTDKDCIKKAKASGKTVALKDGEGNDVDEKGKVLPKPEPKAEAPAAAAASIEPAGEVAALKPGEGAWANYDFLPGEKMLFADDFAADRVGNFPRRLELGSGNMELVEWKGARYVSSTGTGYLVINLPGVLPQKFTFEADVAPRAGTGFGAPSLVFFAPGKDVDLTSMAWTEEDPARGVVEFGVRKVGYRQANTREATIDISESVGDAVYKLRVMADGNYLKVFVNERRVANVPNANIGRSNKIFVYLIAAEGEPAMFGNVRVAAGGRDLYDALAADGRVATHGILFDTGSDRIKPESTPTLKEIGEMLKSHADLKLMIEGHTDNVGAAAANKTLSERRAAAVRAYLTTVFSIDAARLSSNGFGDTKPASPNTTPEGRQQNRRVELVRM